MKRKALENVAMEKKEIQQLEKEISCSFHGMLSVTQEAEGN